MKLILSGGGSGEQVKESYKVFSNLVGNGKVLYVPLAWNHGGYDGCLDWFKSEMKSFGIVDIDMITNANEISEERLKKVKGIFIGGGNTYKLLKMLKESPAYENIKTFMKRKDSVIMGGSAGALIFGRSIDTCLNDGLVLKSCVDENQVGLKDTTGFDCLNGYSILPHYKKLPEQYEIFKIRINRLLEEGFKLICIPEETSIYVDDRKYKVIGRRPVEIFTKQNQISKNVKEEIILK